MLRLPEVRADAAQASIVKVSLSAWNQESFEWINRPDPSLKFADVVAGLRQFRKEYAGELRMEVFLLTGINADPEDVARIAAFADEIKPDLVQLNTAVRPPAEDVAAVPPEKLAELAKLFRQPAEVIADFKAGLSGRIEANEDTILSMLKRRPCTAEHIARVFEMHLNEVAKYTGKLLNSEKIRILRKDGEIYYSAH